MCPPLYLKFIIGSREKLGISSFSSPFNDLRKYEGSDGCRVRMWRGIRLWASPRYSLRIDEIRTQTLVSCSAHGNRLQSLYQLGVEPELIAAQGAKTADMIFKPQPGAAIRGRSN